MNLGMFMPISDYLHHTRGRTVLSYISSLGKEFLPEEAPLIARS